MTPEETPKWLEDCRSRFEAVLAPRYGASRRAAEQDLLDHAEDDIGLLLAEVDRLRREERKLRDTLEWVNVQCPGKCAAVCDAALKVSGPDSPKVVVIVGNGTAFIGTDKVVVSPIRPEIGEGTPRTGAAPSVFEKLWFQCTQCGWGEQQDADETDGWKDGNACPECGIGPIRASSL